MSLLSNWLESLGYDIEISDQCLKKISPFSTCKLCDDACQENAVLIENEKISIVSDQCTGCGTCIPVCPQQAVKGLSATRKVIEKNLLIEEGKPAPTTPELLYFYKKGVRFLVCEDVEDVDESLDAALRETNHYLTAMGLQPFECLDQLRVESSEQPRMTRRGFFRKLTVDGKETVLSSITPAKWRFNEENFRLSKLYPDWSFYSVTFQTESCDLCGACMALCPSKVFEVDNELLKINAQQCTGCRLCYDICRKNGISIEKKLHHAATSSTEITTSTCTTCEITFHSWKETKKCPTCSSRTENNFFI